MWPFGSNQTSSSQSQNNGPVLIISREEVLAMDTDKTLQTLKHFIKDPATAAVNMENVDIAFHGYNDTVAELFEIPEVRDFVHKLDAEFPYWLFILTKKGLGLQCLMFCMLSPHLTPAGKAKHHPQQLETILLQRWFPAMNHACEFVGLSEESIEAMTNRSMRYFTHGREKN